MHETANQTLKINFVAWNKKISGNDTRTHLMWTTQRWRSTSRAQCHLWYCDNRIFAFIHTQKLYPWSIFIEMDPNYVHIYPTVKTCATGGEWTGWHLVRIQYAWWELWNPKNNLWLSRATRNDVALGHQRTDRIRRNQSTSAKVIGQQNMVWPSWSLLHL